MESLRQILARFLNIDLSRLRIFRPALARQSQTDHFVSLEITGTNAGASANQLVSGSTAAYVASQDNTLPQIRAVVLDPDATAAPVLSAGAIVGIVIGSVVGVAVIVLLIVLLVRHFARDSFISEIKHNPSHQKDVPF
jgi:hypothetical protein